ncbi:MAG: DUF3179 domain-containing protein, partial [Chloroflexota bacterium]|nr:DUF3179 domain-containing protein [Chloroflexota bacterium]
SPTVPQASANIPPATATLLPNEPPPDGVTAEFTTDFTKHSVPYADILTGGPPKDGIPAIDVPTFVAVEAADSWLKPNEPVILVQVGAVVRAYPIQILIWHELVNDTVGGQPLVVSFCPLCNTAIAFDRTLDGRVLDFGTTGRLRYSNLIMYDRQTETWWQQATGRAIVGAQTGAQLAFYPAAIVAWADFKAAHPDGQVLSRATGYTRAYGGNPYPGYDDVNSTPFLYRGPVTPGTLPATARVLTIARNGAAVAYPYATLEQQRVVNDAVGDTPVVVFWAAGTASALDASSIAGGRDVGAATAFARVLDGRTLTFTRDGDRVVDDQTGSTWNGLGQAIQGPLVGQELASIVAVNHLWFSWAAFQPDTRIYQP